MSRYKNSKLNPSDSYVNLNKQQIDQGQRKKILVRPYKHPEVVENPLKEYRPFAEDEVRNIKLASVSKELVQAKYNAEKAIGQALDVIRHIEYGENVKNTENMIIKKGDIFRSKMESINRSLDQSISNNLASVVIGHYVSEVSRNRKSKERTIFSELGLQTLPKQPPKVKESLYQKLPTIQPRDPAYVYLDEFVTGEEIQLKKDQKESFQHHLYNLTKQQLSKHSLPLRDSPQMEFEKNMKNQQAMNMLTIKARNQRMNESYYEKMAMVKGVEEDINMQPKIKYLRYKK